MRIVLRHWGNPKPQFEIVKVDYFEPLPARIQFTAVGYEGLQEIRYNKKKELMWMGKAYDFVEVFDN
jgi:hypothetical protein